MPSRQWSQWFNLLPRRPLLGVAWAVDRKERAALAGQS